MFLQVLVLASIFDSGGWVPMMGPTVVMRRVSDVLMTLAAGGSSMVGVGVSTYLVSR